MLLICACVLYWDLGSDILGVSSSMGETVLLCSLSEPLTTAAPLVGLEPCGVFSVYIGMSAGVAIFLVLSRQLYCWNSWACFPCRAWGTLFIQHRHPGLWLLQSSHLLPWRSLRLQCRDCITEACICVGHSAVPYSLHCEQGWLFYNDLCCKKELPWWGVRTARICVCT